MWKRRFEDYIRLTDMEMLLVITQGFDWPSYEKNGVIGRYTYADMPIEERKRYAIEGKALSTLTMALPQDSVHLFKKYTTSKDLWDALERYCEGDVTLKKNRIKLLKRQYEAFNGLKGESLDEIIIRFSHLTTELSYFEVVYPQTELVDKFLDSLPKTWTDYVHQLQDDQEYSTWDFEKVVSKLKNRDMKRRIKDTHSDFTQDPSLYHAKSVHLASSSSGNNAFLSGAEATPIVDAEGIAGYVAYDNTHSNVKSNVQSFHSMPMSMSSAEGRMSVYSAFCNAHEAFIGGKITDPAVIDEDYNQIDPDDLEEMDLQWQLAMLTIKVRRFTQRTGRPIGNGTKCFDKSKVKCYNCDGFGHFARECHTRWHRMERLCIALNI